MALDKKEFNQLRRQARLDARSEDLRAIVKLILTEEGPQEAADALLSVGVDLELLPELRKSLAQLKR